MTWETWLTFIATTGLIYEHEAGTEEPFLLKRYDRFGSCQVMRFPSRRALTGRLQSYSRALLRDDLVWRRDVEYVLAHGPSAHLRYAHDDGDWPDVEEPEAEAAHIAHACEATASYRQLTQDDLMDAARLWARQNSGQPQVAFGMFTETLRAERSAVALDEALSAIQPTVAPTRPRL